VVLAQVAMLTERRFPARQELLAKEILEGLI
jgi:hypothetical protein